MAENVESTNNDGVRRRRAIACGSLAVAGLLACNALTGVGDLEAVDCTVDCDGAAPERVLPEPVVPVDAATTVDAADATPAGDADADAPTRPSFCEGITLYLPFEGSLNGSAGQTPDTPPTIPFAPGKYGQGADLTVSGGLAIYYAATYKGNSLYSLVHGSVAMWVKPTFQPPTAQPALLFKPRAVRAAAAPNAGPVLGFETLLGLTVDAPDGGSTSVGYPQVALPNWNNGGWNHVVGTWSSSAPTLQVALNGATPIATANPWVPNESPVNFLRIGSEVSAPRSVFDDVILWTRVLSASENAALAASPVSAAVACGL